MSIKSKIRKLLEEDGAQGVLDGLVHDRASALATAVNNDGLKAQLEFLETRGMDDEAVLQYLTESLCDD